MTRRNRSDAVRLRDMNGDVHLNAPAGPLLPKRQTLCGLIYIRSDGLQVMLPRQNGALTCETCISIVEHVREYRGKTYVEKRATEKAAGEDVQPDGQTAHSA